jgi:hypothetical protein
MCDRKLAKLAAKKYLVVRIDTKLYRKSENHYYTTIFALSDNKLTKKMRQKYHIWWTELTLL